MLSEKILDLGCGLAKVQGAIGMDIAKLEGVDIVYDLNQTPYPMFEPNSFDLIVMNDVLEHLNEPIKIVEECHRLLKKGGKLRLKVLYWNHKYNYSDPQHKHVFTEIYFDFFLGKRRSYYFDFAFSKLDIEYLFDPTAIKTFGDDPSKLMERAYFYCNVIDAMIVTLTK